MSLPRNCCPIVPGDCAVLVALPFSRADHEMHHRTSDGGFAATRRWPEWETELKCVENLCNNLGKLNADVVRSARFADLRKAFQTHAVVSLVAHWRIARVSAADILDPLDLFDLIRAPRTPIQAAVHGHLASTGIFEPDVASRLSTEETARRLAEAIDAMVESANSWYETRRFEYPPESPERYSRAVFEQNFPQHIRPAEVIELHDRCISIPDLISAIPDGFDGVLDLTLCHSSFAADLIKADRPQSLVSCNHFRVPVLPALVHVQGILTLLSRNPMSYAEARRLIALENPTLRRGIYEKISEVVTRVFRCFGTG